MKVLVTGGVGYIGSHTCVELLDKNHTITIVDNLCNSEIETINRIKAISKKNFSFYQQDIRDATGLAAIFAKESINWSSKYNLNDMCRDTLKWISSNSKTT